MNESHKSLKHTADQVIESFSRCTQNGFVTFNDNGQITHFSKIMEELTGWHESEMLGKSKDQLFTISGSVARLIEDKAVRTQPAILYTRDGRKLTLETRQTVIKKSSESGSEVGGYLIIFVVNTSDVDRAQAEFVSTVSHELRTPITSIKGFAATLLHHRKDLDEEKRKKYINIIKDQAERLSRLVEDLLAVSRLESKKLQFTIQPIDLEPVVDQISTMVQSKYRDSHKVNIHVDPDVPTVWADVDRLDQILTNLIDNAFKYSPAANSIDIKVSSCTHNTKHMARIDITDYGVGIDPKHIEAIFTKFSRLDTPLTRTTEGTGLGLFITKSLAEIMHCQIEVTSKEGQTTFSLFLPTNSFNIENAVWN